MAAIQDLGAIPGLALEDAETIALGSKSDPISFSAGRSKTIVFHGHAAPFEYEYYGAHIGTEDRLTFFSAQIKPIRCWFLDCRSHSESWGERLSAELYTNTNKTLIIPPGVAHTFSGLEDVYTVNSFRNLLPEPNCWLSQETPWSVSADTINIERNIPPQDIPRLQTNMLPASKVFYDLTWQGILNDASSEAQSYPLSKIVQFENGERLVLKFRRQQSSKKIPLKATSVSTIQGVRIQQRIAVVGDDDSTAGYTVFGTDHKLEMHYNTDSLNYSLEKLVHLDRRVIFLGQNDEEVLVFVAADGSEDSFIAKSSPMHEAIIPQGVACKVGNSPHLVFALSITETVYS